MATLKSDLDDYLLQNDSSRRGFKITLPTISKPKWFSRSEDETPSSTNSWLSETQKEWCPSLSRTNRLIGFVTCMLLGLLCFILSTLYIPFLILKARKFALLYTLGSCFFIFSFSFLYGPWNHIKQMFTKERILTTIVYGGALIATLYCALGLQNTILTIIFAVLQIFALIWMTMGSIPGDEALTCNVCDRTFPCQRQLESHQQKKRHFGCSACDSLYLSLMALEHHKEEFQHWSDDEEYCSAGYDSESSDDTAPSEDCERLL